jgi:hypothetical protein
MVRWTDPTQPGATLVEAVMIRRNTRGAHGAEPRTSQHREWLVADDETPPLAAHVISSRTGYTHHGIYVGDGKVVHYAGLSRGLRRGPVEEVSLAAFAHGRPIKIRPPVNPRFDRTDVLARARSRLGENRYRLLSNNCEHFSEWCVCGVSRSWQVDSLRMRPRCIVRALLSFLRRPAASESPAAVSTLRMSGMRYAVPH